jgi:anti-sigma regulatory factor (Ser/Thr protein kinase)
MPEVTLTMRCRLENLAFGGAAARGIALEHMGVAAAGLVEMAITEVSSNIVRHAHPNDPEHEFTVALRSVGETLEIEIRDAGRPFSFEPRSELRIDVTFDELPEKGLGLALVHEAMDVVEYRRTDDVNIVRLVKRAGTAARR